jgi:hypothetical protein
VTTHQPAFPVCAPVLGQWGPGFDVSRDGVEVATAAGSLARDSTSAISWSPKSLYLIGVVRRSDVKRNPALMANPIARPGVPGWHGPAFPKIRRAYVTVPEYGTAVVNVSGSAAVSPRPVARPRAATIRRGGIRWRPRRGCCAPPGSSVG